jgi:hypothetical protein
MKVFIGFVIFVCLAFPVFSQSQSPNADLFSALSNSLDSSISRSTSVLADYDSWSSTDGDFKMYSSYKKRYDDIVKALKDSEAKMDLLHRTYDRADYVKKERDNYDDLLTQLKTVKSEYDTWLGTIR